MTCLGLSACSVIGALMKRTIKRKSLVGGVLLAVLLSGCGRPEAHYLSARPRRACGLVSSIATTGTANTVMNWFGESLMAYSTTGEIRVVDATVHDPIERIVAVTKSRILSAAIDESGRVAIGTENAGMYVGDYPGLLLSQTEVIGREPINRVHVVNGKVVSVGTTAVSIPSSEGYRHYVLEGLRGESVVDVLPFLGKYVVVGSMGTIVLLDQDAKVFRRTKVQGLVTQQVTVGAGFVALGTNEGFVYVLNETLEQLATFQTNLTVPATALETSADGRTLYVGDFYGWVYKVMPSLKSKKGIQALRPLFRQWAYVRDIASNDNFVVASTSAGEVGIYDMAAGKTLPVYGGKPLAPVYSIALSNAGRIAMVTYDKKDFTHGVMFWIDLKQACSVSDVRAYIDRDQSQPQK
jgi:hypothetical protein